MPCAQRISRLSLRVLLAVALVLPAAAEAQFLSGGVYGTVLGPEAKPLVGATVSLQGPTHTRPAVTGAEGQFHFLGLAPGNYQLRAEASGFDAAEYPSVPVSPGRSTAVQVRMSTDPTETITVTAEPPQFDTTRFSPVLTVNHAEIATLPTPRDPWALAQLLPGVLASEVNAGGSASGQQPLLVAPGASSEQNAFVFDGVAITDLAATGASPTYFDVDQFEEVRIGSGGSDASQSTSGVVVDMTTRRGTNGWRGSLRGFATGDNTAQAQSNGAGSNAVRSVREAGGEVGGDLVRDRGWLWAAGSLSHILRQAFGGAPVDIRLNNETAKLNLQLGDANSAVALFNRSGKVWNGRGATATRSRETLIRQIGTVDLFKLEDTLVAGSRWTLSGFASTFDGGYSQVPFAGRDAEPVGGPDGVWRNGWVSGRSVRAGSQLRLSGVGQWPGVGGGQDLSFGAGERRFRESSSMRAGLRNLMFEAAELVGGDEDVASAMRYGKVGTTLTLREAWIQDTLRLDHTTVSAGLRLDDQSGRMPATHLEANPAFPEILPAVDLPALGPQFRWHSVSPRLGLAREIGRDGRTVLGASYARFAEQLGSGIVARGSQADTYAYVAFQDRNGDHIYQPGEPYQAMGVYTSGGQDRVDPSLAPQTTDVISLDAEQAIGDAWKVRLDLSARRVSDILESRLMVAGADGVARQALRDDYVLSRTLTATLPDGTTVSLPVYALRGGLSSHGHVLVNGDRSQTYRGATLSLVRSYRDGWMLRTSATFGDWRWHLGSDFRRHDDPTDVALGMLGDGFDPTDTDGEIVAQQADLGDRRDTFLNSGWSFGANGLVQVAPSRPWSFLVAANVVGRQGYPIPYAVRTFGVDGIARWVQATPRGDTYRTADLYTADVRLEKDFKLPRVTLAASLEAFNLFDTRVALQRSRQLGTSAPPVLETMSPRVLRAGLRVSVP